MLGHALKKALRMVADQQERELTEVAQEAGADMVCAPSLKAALDQDWDRLTLSRLKDGRFLVQPSGLTAYHR